MSNSIVIQLQNDLKVAMRSGDELARNTIRYAQASIKNREIDLQRPLEEEETEAILRKQIKQRQDSIELFNQGGRTDLVEKETEEINVLKKYLPDEMTDEDLKKIVEETADEVCASGPSDMKLLMPALISRVEGRADGRRLSILASEELKRRV